MLTIKQQRKGNRKITQVPVIRSGEDFKSKLGEKAYSKFEKFKKKQKN